MKKQLQDIVSSLQSSVLSLGVKGCNLKFALLLLLITASCQLTHAQLYPVQTVHNIVPPYNTKLNDYATSLAIKLRLRLILNDNNVSNRQVRLKLKIQGNGLNIQSTDIVAGAPFIYLNGGTSQVFTNIDLAAYFQLHNLIGINSQQYNRPLPDGAYKICWEVYDFQTNQLISNPNMGCDNVFLLLNDPPFLNLPNRGDQLTSTTPFINFTWTPRHANATNVSYEFELREVWDTQIDPQAGFLATPNYYTQTVFSTTLVYGIGKPELFPGRTYAWRVRAISSIGLSENSVFRNDGYSEIYYFTYANECFPPTMTLAEPLNTGRVNISWQTHPDHNKYHIQYKRADVADAEWFEVFSYNNQTQIGNLQAGVTYDFRVGGTCHSLTDLNQGYSYSTPNQFTMPTADETVSYSCGIVPEIEISNTTPLSNLGVNETFTAGDFPVTVKQIQGGNGSFSGVGYIVVPYLADTKIAVEFTGIKINTEYQLYDGIIKTTYDPTWSGVEDVGDLFNGADGQVNINEVDFPIGEIIIDPNGDILIVGEGGSPIVELPGGKDYIITDGSTPPKKYSVDEEGNVTELGEQAEGGSSTAENTNGVNSDGQATSLTAQGVKVTFTKAPNNVYGFDGYDSSQSTTKDLYKKLGNNYYMPYKAVAKGKDDYIVANLNISDTNIQPQDLIFKTKDGVVLTKIDSTATTYTLKLTAAFVDADIETQAVIKQGDKYQIAGAFMQYQSAIKDVNVVLVNTVNVNTLTITDELKRIYQQSMVNLNVTVINDFTSDLNALAPDGNIQSGESGFLANYTNQQQSINSVLKSSPDYKQNAYYLILTDKTPSTAGEKGLMPIGRQFGYIYDISSKTMAHELGHGAFQLKHPFSTHSYGWSENATDWLLDYNNGEHLPYAHWKNIHNPDIHIGIFDGDGEGEYTDGLYFEKLLQQIRCAYIDGENSISLPERYKNKAKDEEVFKFIYGFPVKNKVINGDKISLASIKTENKDLISNITTPNFINNSQIEFNGLILKFTTPSYSVNNGITPWKHLTDYLFPKDEETVKEEYSNVLNQLLNKTIFTDDDIKSLKRIANCGARYFTTNNKYLIISKIANNSFALTEYYEDLILDLLENYNGDVITYSNELIKLLNEDPQLLRKLFNGIDNENGGVLWRGNENNFTRFLDVLYGLWKYSKYAKKDDYSYIDVGDTFDVTVLSPEFITYDGKSWFPNVSYSDVSFQKGKFTMNSKTIYGKYGRLEYQNFQPVYLGFIKDTDKIRITKVEVPAIYFAGTVKKDNLEKSLDQIGLTLDVALTLSAVGNVAKLRHLSKLQQIGRITLASVEITSGFADIMVRYTDLCEGNEDFCKAFQEYNTYLQLGLLSSGLIRAKFKTTRNNAKEEYIKHRDVLVNKYGETNPKIKELDLHFGLANGVDDFVDGVNKTDELADVLEAEKPALEGAISGTQKQHAEDAIIASRTFTNSDLTTQFNNFINRIADLGQDATVLQNKLNDLDDLTKTKFLDDFEGAINDVLTGISQETNSVDSWLLLLNANAEETLRNNFDFIKVINFEISNSIYTAEEISNFLSLKRI